MQSATNLAM